LITNGEQDTVQRFQVLSLDGGGILGIFTAALLVGLEEDLGRPVVEHFDLVVGTSTGGIIALGLGAGMSVRDILDLYVTEMKTIFPGPRRLRSLRQLIRAKYKAGGLQSVVQEAFGTLTLAHSRVPLVIPSFDLGENRVYLFKTPHHPRLKRDWKVPLWQVAMATSAAPTFFPAFSLPNEHVRLADGGIWANNPSMVGIVEAVSMFGRPLDSIRLLSLGTTADPRARNRSLDKGGLFQWIRSPNIANVLLQGQSYGALTQAQHLIGMGNILRLDAHAPPGLSALDHADARDLIAKAAHHSRVFCPEFERVFGGHVAPTFEPLYRN
jgi:uncharacterized protein